MSNNDFSDFLLKEYENIAKAYFSAHELTAKWFKFYLLILASPFSIIVLIYHNTSAEFDLFNLSSTISLLIFVIGILSMFISFIIINSRLDASLYARTVNGVRKYFTDQLKNESSKFKHKVDIDEYLVLPIDIKKPRFLKYEGDLFILVIIMTITNALYIAFGITQFFKTYRCANILSFFIFSLFVILHALYYLFFSKKKEKTYSQESAIEK